MKQFCAMIACLVVSAAYLGAAEYHVSPSGKDDNAGTAAKPFKTIEHGVGLLKPGDTLLIHAGTYGAFMVHGLQGTAEKPITIKAPEKEKVVIDRYPDGGMHTIHLMGTCRYIIFENLEVTDSDPKIEEYRKLDLNKPEDVEAWKKIAQELAKDPNQQYRSGVRINPPAMPPQRDKSHSHLVFRKLTVHHILGLGFTGNGDNLEFIDNHVYDLGYPPSGYAWYMSGINQVYRGNRVHDCSYGMHLYTQDEKTDKDPISNTLVENNLIYNTGKMFFHGSSQKVSAGGSAILLWAPGDHNIIRNNVLVDDYTGINLISKDSLVINNTITGGKSGIFLVTSDKPVTRNNTVCNNIVVNTSGEALTIPEGENITVSHNFVTGDPKFVDVSKRDLHLKAGSPAIDAGAETKQVPTDIEGTKRPQGKTWDIGAYEFKGAGQPATAPGRG
jgi:parallel beta-helix repeat protein